MSTIIYATVHNKGMHSFYMYHNGKDYYLFSQNYRKGVKNYFSGGVCINDALDCSRAHNDTAILKTMKKLPCYIKYVEDEYGITVLKRTEKKRGRSYSKSYKYVA